MRLVKSCSKYHMRNALLELVFEIINCIKEYACSLIGILLMILYRALYRATTWAASWFNLAISHLAKLLGLNELNLGPSMGLKRRNSSKLSRDQVDSYHASTSFPQTKNPKSKIYVKPKRDAKTQLPNPSVTIRC